MTTGLTYATYLAQISVLAVVPQTDVNFIAITPQMITYAENRICRDLDFLQTVTTLTSRSTTSGNPNVTLGADANTPDFITLQEINVITPAGTSDPTAGTIDPLIPVTKEWLRWMYPSAASKGAPQYFAPITQAVYALGPWPDAAYTLQAVGTTRPDSLSESTSATFISTYLPDLMIMASMIYITLFQRNFSAVASDPQMGFSYEAQYAALLKGSVVEEARKKFQASAWSSMSPPAAATPSR